MPVPGFLASFADKAQNAINATPLAAHIPASLQHRASSPDPATQPSANDAAAQGGAKSHTLESLQYQLRSFQQQYSTTTPVQKIITVEKGLAIDFDSVSRNSKAQSKELYTWGQSEAEDLKDVTDRLAYLNFVQGSLASSLSAKLDAARAPLKALRDAEASLQPRRNIRAGFQTQIARLEHEQQKGGDKRIAEVRDQLRKAELDDQPLEKEVELLKRKAVRESEQIKWDAIREYGEKLVLLSQAASPIIAVLPTIPPSPTLPYSGAQTTGAIRASLQRALDNYKTGHINLPAQTTASDLSRSDTRSFGESHAKELSRIHSDVPSVSHSPNKSTGSASQSSSPPPINPHALNQAPAPITSVSPPLAAPTSSDGPVAPLPTVAETGMPLSAGPEGPGPASGSLHDIKHASSDAGPRSGGLPGNESIVPPYGQHPVASPIPRHESAEEEKRRLAAAYSQAPGGTNSNPTNMPIPSVAPAQAPHQETAEEEKKRLEREERERLLHAGGSGPAVPPKDKGDDSDLPPYQEPGV
ncbi:Sphingolipid long chain base-responsive protein LSP1 [Psilocybe cubensis]|uniref:Sphingolipid long chain base-responsive protein LSP1 n=2 Tax=Psilocybe cubensis TaxID=181762 RepID=A0A8H7Y8C1_PSICU|nr:Sphingolipid long chain base-responsive protein LSP1 [Psilocybe cubensis]KAH9486874.1 Sphingolipid long chain base-responsive protein LSP1 [Psilocybe cubensis]